MIKKTILVLISTLLIVSSAGCSKKAKDQSTVGKINKPVAEENVEKETSKDKEEIKEDKPSENTTADSGTNNKPSETINTSKPKPEKPVNQNQKPEPPKQEIKPEVKPDVKPEVKPDGSDSNNNSGTVTPEPPQQSSPKVSEIANKIIQEVNFARMIPMPEKLSADFYPFDRNLVSEYGIYQAMMNIKSDELAVFKVKDEKSFAEIEKGIQKRLTHLDKIWSQYLPDQYEKVKKHIIIRKGNYIIFAISDNQDKVKEVFNSFFSK